MALTHAGKVFVVCVVVFGVAAYWLASRMVRRQTGGTRGSGGAVAFWWLVSFCLVSLFFPFAYWIGDELYELAVSPKYEATVVSYQSEWDTCERRDSSGRTATYRCIKYTSILEAVMPDGERVVLPGNIRSGSVPEIGERVNVVLPQGANQLHERSVRSVGLLAGGGLMVAMTGYFLYLIAAYGAGRNLDRAARFGVAVVMNGLVPLGALLMEIGFLSVPYRYWARGNPEQWPVWVLALCLLFALSLLPLLLIYARTAWRAVVK
ncbi:uracil permease [Burkholderia lata]|uniref:uracil permease n=1 Tax=Burkholderia lata (strain ATCC 17760 / DSM 23089 / LMG 22485 / NCIMB 9086 / R18194 / 383) TaxID=482957 RepID=UPI001454318A|nr:uracil permease [Burkholderia lata]VWB10676.1 uracil permease [Burkholderia lata]